MKYINSLLGLPDIQFSTPIISDEQILIPGISGRNQVKCPCCKKKSKSVHSSYIRKLRDLSVGEYSVIIHLTVRKFYCRNRKCKRKIFTEQPGKEVKAYARMTQRTKKKLEKILIETSANKGALISRLIQTPVSPSTALRLVGSMSINYCGKIKTLGIDDWAYRKGISYGTILMDMDKGTVIDLLPGRDGAEVKRFLESHQEVEFVCRDRSSAFSAAVNEVLPKANQIADRFHLVKNLSDSVYEVIKAEYPNLVQSLKSTEIQETNGSTQMLAQKAPERVKGEPSPYRKQVFSDVKKMITEGMGYKTIARQLQISRNTVRNYADLDSLSAKPITLRNDYYSYLQDIGSELSKGETLLSTYNTIVTLGFKGSYSAFFEQFKDHPSRNAANKGSCSASSNDVQKISALSPRKISIYLSLSRFNKIQNETEKAQMRYLIKKNSLIKKLRKQVRLFKEILKEGTPELLDNWMEQTLLLKKKKLISFVRGLKRDIKAVYNAIIFTWSSGMVEGNINRLKNIKRQMYGRASLELLKRKVILSSTG
jgi:transposase